MKRIISYFSLCAFLLIQIGAAWAASEEDAFTAQIYGYLQAKKFLELERVANDLRKEQGLFSTGRPKLRVFYDSLLKDSDDISIDERKAYIRRLDEWDETIKNSATAKIALADAYINLGWAYRGDGWGKTVTKEGSAGFNEALGTAMQYLYAAEEINNKDPQIYGGRLRAGMGLGMPKVLCYEEVLRTLLVFPGYYSPYLTMAVRILPRWGGEDGEVVRFAEWLAAMTEDEYGNQMYVLIAKHVLDYVGQADFHKFKFDMPRIVNGFKEYYALYPEIGDDLHFYAWLMLQGGDLVLAEKLFERIKYSDEKKEIRQFWHDQKNFDYWKGIAKGTVEATIDNAVLAAAKEGDPEALQQAVESGADINARDNRGNTPLMIAIDISDKESAKYLINHGTILSIENEKGEDALFYAVREGQVDIVKLLIEKEADVHKKDEYGWSVIHHAASRGYLDVIKVLIENDKNLIYTEDKWQRRPLDCAAEKGYQNIVEYLLSIDSKVVDLPIYDNSTPLHIAVEKGHTGVAEVLINHGADVNAVTNRGNTPFSLALESKDLKLINMLKDLGAQEGTKVVSLEDAKTAYEHYKKGYKHYQSKEWAQAEKEFLTSIKINPRHFESYQMLDYVLMREKRWEEIIGYWNQFLALNSNHAGAYLERSGAYHHKGDRANANADLLKSCNLGNAKACQLYERFK